LLDCFFLLSIEVVLVAERVVALAAVAKVAPDVLLLDCFFLLSIEVVLVAERVVAFAAVAKVAPDVLLLDCFFLLSIEVVLVAERVVAFAAVAKVAPYICFLNRFPLRSTEAGPVAERIKAVIAILEVVRGCGSGPECNEEYYAPKLPHFDMPSTFVALSELRFLPLKPFRISGDCEWLGGFILQSALP